MDEPLTCSGANHALRLSSNELMRSGIFNVATARYQMSLAQSVVPPNQCAWRMYRGITDFPVQSRLARGAGSACAVGAAF
jgi:hypothetical protein